MYQSLDNNLTITRQVRFKNLVRISEGHKKKQEADSDLLCLWVPRTDKSCNLLP
jgi:hypothetical protein